MRTRCGLHPRHRRAGLRLQRRQIRRHDRRRSQVLQAQRMVLDLRAGGRRLDRLAAGHAFPQPLRPLRAPQGAAAGQRTDPRPAPGRLADRCGRGRLVHPLRRPRRLRPRRASPADVVGSGRLVLFRPRHQFRRHRRTGDRIPPSCLEIPAVDGRARSEHGDGFHASLHPAELAVAGQSPGQLGHAEHHGGQSAPELRQKAGRMEQSLADAQRAVHQGRRRRLHLRYADGLPPRASG